MTRWVRIIIFVFCLCVMHASCYGVQKVLVVHSYHAEYEWVDQINKGIERAISRDLYEVKYHYMDTKRRTDESWKLRAGKLAMQICKDYAPDIVIACDDNAQAYFASELSRKTDGPMVVFCGVNSEPELYGYPNDKATGILERPHITNTLRLAKRLKPSINKVTILCDKSVTGDQILQHAQTLRMPLTITRYVTAEDFQQWQTQVNQANIDSDALLVVLYHTVKSNSMDPESMPPSEVMDWTVKHSRIPILGLYPFTVDDGAAIAVSASPMEHGYLAARMAMDLLSNNIKASRFPMNTGVEGMIMFNLITAKKFDIQVPAHLLKMAQHIVQNDKGQQASGVMPKTH